MADKKLIPLVALMIVLTFSLFLVDTLTPLGMNEPIGYVFLILLSIFIQGLPSTLIVGITGFLLTIAGYYLSPVTGENQYGLENRILSLIAIGGSCITIIKYKQTKRLAIKQKEHLDAIFNNAAEGIIIISENASITMMNPMAKKMVGITAENEGYKLWDLFENGMELFNQFVRQKTENNIHWHGVTNPLFPSEERILQVKMSHCTIDKSLIGILFISDITDKTRQEKELQLTNEKLKNTNHNLELFVHTASHDLQEPLRKIVAFGDRVKQTEWDHFQEKSKDYFERMISGARRMQSLLQDLLQYSRHSQQNIDLQRVDIESLIRECLEAAGDLEENDQIILSFPEEKLGVLGDEKKLFHVFQNLLSNALKFRKADIPLELRIYATPIENHQVEIVISDNGIGFPEHLREKIFQFLFRVDQQKQKGTGIGLAIVKKIILLHDGKIEAHGEEGKGASFTIQLPLYQEKNKEPKQA